jgi:hypothetical protein
MSELVNIVSRDKGVVTTKKVRAAPYEFTLATRAKWEMIIADENVVIGEGKFDVVKIKEVNIEKDSLAIPCAFSHHAIASVIKVGVKGGAKTVESDRVIDKAYVIGQQTGEIKKGDLLAVINVFPIMFTREAKSPVIIE